jgi:hypothetical protein
MEPTGISELLHYITFSSVRNSKYYKIAFPKLDHFPSSGEGRKKPIP